MSQTLKVEHKTAKIVQIGTSKGIRIPANMLKQMNSPEKVDISIENDTLVVRPIEVNPRKGWMEAFNSEPNNELLLDDNEGWSSEL